MIMVEAQTQKVLEEVQMKYTRGITFRLCDLQTIQVCKNENNYKQLVSRVKSKITAYASVVRNTIDDQTEYRMR